MINFDLPECFLYLIIKILLQFKKLEKVMFCEINIFKFVNIYLTDFKMLGPSILRILLHE